MKHLRLLPLVAACLSLLAADAAAQVSGVGYRLVPSGSYVRWDGDAALDDGFLYGGGVGLSFGEYVELTGLYLFGSDFETDFSDFSGIEDAELDSMLTSLDPRGVDLQRYGGELKLNLGSGSLIPFLTAGAGLIRFDVEDKEPTRNIYLTGGAGLQVSLADRYTLTLQAEDLAYRYNPGTTFFTPGDLAETNLTLDDFNQTLVHNISFRAALQLYLGGRRPGELSDVDRAFLDQFSDGLRGVSLQIEPFYSRVNFNDAFTYRDQSFVGAEVGVNLGPLVGLRGFFARGVDTDDPTDFEPIQMYGGDAKLRLASGQGIVPFLTFGAGYLDVLSDYNEADGGGPFAARSEDRPFALGGGGLELPLGDRLRLHGEVRGLLMSTQDEGDISQTEDVFLSPQYRAGVSFGLGGDVTAPIPVVTQAELERQIAAERAAAEAELAAEIARAQAEGDSLAVARLTTEQRRAGLVTGGGTAGVPVVVGREVRTAQGDRIVTVPLPEQGELYVRYGDPGGVQIESVYDGEDVAAAASGGAATETDLREIVRETLRESLAAQGDAATTEDVAEIERRVEERLLRQLNAESGGDVSATEMQLLERRIEDRLSDEIDDLRDLIIQQNTARQNNQPIVVPSQSAQPNVVAVTPEGEVVSTTSAVVNATPGGFVAAYPVVGFGFGSGATQAVFGLRADYRPGGASTLRYYPEFTLGFGGERSFALNVNAAFPLPSPNVDFAPYAGLGLGILGFNDSGSSDDGDDEEDDLPGSRLTINLVIGTEYTVGRNRVFTEFQTASFGDFNRLIAGYRFLFR